MKSQRAAFGITSLLAAGALVFSATAWAGPAGHMRGGGDWNKGNKARSVRSGGGIGSGENLQRLGRAVNDARGNSRGSNTPVLDALRDRRGSDTPILDALRDGGRGRSDTPILDELRDRYNDNRGYRNGYYGHGHHHDDDVADAYRDATIANAVVNLVGIAVSAATQPRVQTVVAPAPAPVVVVEPEPRGYYSTEKVLVSEGFYEDVRVWVPECRDHHGRITGGYYEVHKRWNPPVYDYRPVWVNR